MKRPVLYSLAAAGCLILAPCVVAQEPAVAEAYEVLASIAGEYTYEDVWTSGSRQPGEITFTLIRGDRFLRFEETWTDPGGTPIGTTGLIGYDAIRGYFTWYRVFDNGAYDLARGTLENGIITFDLVDTQWEPFGEYGWAGPGVALRTKWTVAPEGGLTYFVWERSVDGGPWELMSEGRNTRVQ